MLNSLKSAFSKLFSATSPLSQRERDGVRESPSHDGSAPYDLHLSTNRNGKIAHLPRDLRDRVCQCIYDGASLTKLAAELNEFPGVKAMLANHFEGNPISQQNLSEWKAGGYRDWLLQRQLLENKAETVADVQQLADTADGLADHLFGLLTLDYAQIMMNRDKDDEKTFEKKRAALSILSQDIVRLRRCHVQARRVELQEGRFERDEEKTRDQVIHKFAEWASHPDIRRIFILEPQNHDRLMREKFGLPPTREDKALLRELGINPNSTPPIDPQTSHKPPHTEKCEPPTDPPAPSDNSKLKTQNSSLPSPAPDIRPLSPVSPIETKPTPCPIGANENSPALQCRDSAQNNVSPGGTAETSAKTEPPTSSLSQRERVGVRESGSDNTPAPIHDTSNPNSKPKTQNSTLPSPAPKKIWPYYHPSKIATPRPQAPLPPPHPLFQPPPVEITPSNYHRHCPSPFMEANYPTSKFHCG